MVTTRSLKKFIESGGYSICKKQSDGTYTGVAEAVRRSGLTKNTVKALIREHPTNPIPTAKIFFLNEADCSLLKDLESRMSEVEKLAESTRSFLEECLIVSMRAVSAKHQLQGLSEEEAFRSELRNAENLDVQWKKRFNEIEQKLALIRCEIEKIHLKEYAW